MSSDPQVFFAQCGVRFRSEIDVHLPPCPGPDWDVDVRWGSDLGDSRAVPPGQVIASYDLDGDRWYTATSSDRGYRLRFHGCGEFVIDPDLSSIEVRRDPVGRSELLPILLAGTTTAFLLALRGATVLHASAVKIDGVATAFVGQSGRGKSTLAALMCADGADLITDDVLTVHADTAVTCLGGASELRLRPKAATIATKQRGAAFRATADERIALAAAQASPGPVPLGMIVIPSPSTTVDEVAVRRLPPTIAVCALLAFPRVHGWSSPEVLTRDFAVISRIANLLPVYEVTVPWGPPFSPDIAPALCRLAVHGEIDPAELTTR